MLSAEHVALQSRLVQQLVTVRQREMDTILARYSALGTQASLLAGFAITSLTALSPSEPTVSTPITHLFYGSSIVCLLACIHVIICTMYTCNWAPALALRGPSGSLTRAYKAVRGEKNQINAFFEAATDPALKLSATVSDNQITITNGDAATTNGALDIGLRAQTGGTPGSSAASGGLGALQTIDVTTDAGATGALAAIEGLIDQSIDAAAAFGSAQSRIETQSDFVSKLTDSLRSGIGSLVDADLEEASARLQALQVQQQLATQSLSIANQAPQSILALFR